MPLFSFLIPDVTVTDYHMLSDFFFKIRKTGCSLSGEEGGVEVSVDCDEADAEERESVDFGGMIGAGVTFPLNERLGLNISGGMDMGLKSLDASEDSDDIKNRAFFGTVALTFPVGG